jgi:hypothetical protein
MKYVFHISTNFLYNNPFLRKLIPFSLSLMTAVVMFIQNKPELIGCQHELPSVSDLFKLYSIVLEVQHLDKWTNTNSCICIIYFVSRMLKRIWN